MTNEVSAWLANHERKYTDGLAIYNKYKISAKHDQFFNSVENPPPDSMHYKLLFQKVSDINRKLRANASRVKPEPSKVNKITTQSINTDQLAKVKDSKKKNEPKRPHVVGNPLVDVKELPDELKVKFFENKEFTNLLNKKHEELTKVDKAAKFDPERKRLAKQIAELDDKRAGNWKAIDEWWDLNKIVPGPGKPNVKKPSIVKDANRISNLKNYIRRANTDSKKHPNKKKRNEKKIDKWQKELDGLTGTNS